MQNAAAAFYQIMPDVFDYFVVFYSTDWRERIDPGSGLPINIQPDDVGNAYHAWTRNHTRGIGFSRSPGREFGNRAGGLTPPLATRRLQSRMDMNDLAEYDSDFKAFDGRSGISVFGQEMGHRFVAFADVVPFPGLVLRRSDGDHWADQFNSFGSCVGGTGGNLLTPTLFSPTGPIQWEVTAQEITYGDWDEYLMGFLPPGAVAPSFKLRPLGVGPPTPYTVGQRINGTSTNYTIAEVIANEGPRRPGDTLSQRVFHVGACLVIPNNDPVCVYDVTKVKRFVDEFADFWRTETSDRGFLTSRMCPPMYTQPETAVFVEGYPVDGVILPDGKKLYVAMKRHELGAVAVIDTDPSSPTFHTVLKHISLPAGDASGIDCSADGFHVYVTAPTGNNITVIKTTSDTVIGTFPVGLALGGLKPLAIAVGKNGPAANLAYVLCGEGNPSVSVIDLSSGNEVDSFATDAQLAGQIPDVELTPDGQVAVFTSTGGAGTVIARLVGLGGAQQSLTLTGTPTGVAIVQLESNADNTVTRALASTVPPALVYVTTSNGGTRVCDLTVVGGFLAFRQMPIAPDTAGPPFVPDIPGAGAVELEFSRGGNFAVIGDMATDTLTLVNTSGHGVLQSIPLDPPADPGAPGADPHGFVFSPDGQRLYVMENRGRRVSVLR